MRNAKVALLAVTGLAILGGVLFHGTPPVSNSEISALEESPKMDEARSKLPPKPSATPVSSVTLAPLQDSVSVAEKAQKPFPQQEALNDFSVLNKKVFLNEEEKQRKARLLGNADFLRSLQELFKMPNDYADREDQQNAAVDLLLGAVSADSRSVAKEVLKAIIEDPSTENESLPLADRQNLAGVKAEVLHRWSSQDPEMASEMERWLPGPISQKLWQNVLAHQENNVAESAVTK